jgi:selenocysteine-specific elongation factor
VTVVVGTAGHIDHGKTTLLRALTGIDADRLPEERRRGMTIDVGYAHVDLEGGESIDFVDVPGHDRLVGNMLVGAGEIDAALLVVAADDGPRAQTLEHLALLDALDVRHGIAVVTKADLVDRGRIDQVIAAVERLLDGTSLAGSPVLSASAADRSGLDELHAALEALIARVGEEEAERPPTLAIDRVFIVRGRGTVVTGTLRGGPLARGDTLRVVPGEGRARIREVQVHGAAVERVAGGGRTACNVTGVDAAALRRGMVLTVDPEVVATDRVLVALRSTLADRVRGRLHAGTAAVDATVGRAGRDAITLPDGRAAGVLRLAEPIALRPSDRLVFRRGATVAPVGGIVLDTVPARGVSRRRQTPERVAALATRPGGARARIDLHGALARPDGVHLADDVAAMARTTALEATVAETTLVAVRDAVARAIRRMATIRRNDAAVAAAEVVDGLVAEGRLARDGERVRPAGAAPEAPDPAAAAAMDRLSTMLAVPAPPPLAEAARAAGCTPEGIRALERAGRIVVLAPDLAYAMSTYRSLAATALSMAGREPLTPAAFRDATGTSRKYVMAILEDLDRRAILSRTAEGHVPGPRAPEPAAR